MSTAGLIAGVLCVAVAFVVVLSAIAYAATASRERDIEGGRR
ncbi:MAG: hypothetical protein ACM30G_08990 [Micromonosporaceae bacterium]